MKENLFLKLIMAACLMALGTLMAEAGITVFDSSYGFDGDETNEYAYNLFDGDSDTKWCYYFYDATTPYVIFAFDESVTITGYTLVDAKDTFSDNYKKGVVKKGVKKSSKKSVKKGVLKDGIDLPDENEEEEEEEEDCEDCEECEDCGEYPSSYPGRHWGSWTLYGANFDDYADATKHSEAWVILDDQINHDYKDNMSEKEYKEQLINSFFVNDAQSYKYYKLEINSIGYQGEVDDEDLIHQMAGINFTFCSHKNTDGTSAITVNHTNATCSSYASDEQSCSICGLTGVVFDYDGGLADHTFDDAHTYAGIDASCTSKGLHAHKDCTVCGAHCDMDGEYLSDICINRLAHTLNSDSICSVCKNHIYTVGSYDPEHASDFDEYSTYPYSSGYKYSTVLTLYNKDLFASTGNIVGLEYNVTYNVEGGRNTDEVKIYMALVDYEKLYDDETDDVTFDFDDITFTEVYSGAPVLGAYKGWEVLMFNNAFSYNASKNLLIAVTRKSEESDDTILYLEKRIGYEILTVEHSDDTDSDYGDISYGEDWYIFASAVPSTRFLMSTSTPTDVQETTAKTATNEVICVDLLGRKASADQKGIVIIRQANGETIKVLNK